MVRKLDSIPLPYDPHKNNKQNRSTMTIYNNEKQMLETFIHRLH